MNARSISLSLAVIAAAALAAACSKESKEAAPEPSAPDVSTGAPDPDENAPTPEPAGEAELETVLAHYEAIRALLAADQGEGVADRAKQLEAAAATAGPVGGEEARPHLTALAAAARELAAVEASDLDAMRLAFGELSRPMVALHQADEELAARYHVFECPMAKGYKRWVQPTDELENPYMGQEMLTCGSEVTGD
jgi:hypothetical protein